MDGLPPSPPAEVRPAPPAAPAPASPSPPYVYAATDIRARGAREQELCEKAGSFDWLYVSGTVALNVVAGFVDAPWLKEANGVGTRMLGPIAVGTTFGIFVGGSYLALPKCSPDWIGSGMPEGEVHTHWPLAVSLALLAGVVAPVVQAVEIGGDPVGWGDAERSSRVIVTGVAGFGGAFLPYLLPPRTWRAAQELENLRLRYDSNLRAPVIGYGFAF